MTARTYPLLILLALVLLGAAHRAAAVRSRRTLGAAAGAVAVVLLPFLVANPRAILRTYQVWWDSAAGLGSPWMIPQLVGPPAARPARPPCWPSSAWSSRSLVGAGLRAQHPPAADAWPRSPWSCVAVALLTGKAFPVQASLWLLPLVALCGLRWRDHLLWAGAEALHFVAVWLYVGGLSKPDRGLPPGWYAVFLVLRVAAVAYLVWRVWHTGRRPRAARGDRDDARPDRCRPCGPGPSDR